MCTAVDLLLVDFDHFSYFFLSFPLLLSFFSFFVLNVYFPFYPPTIRRDSVVRTLLPSLLLLAPRYFTNLRAACDWQPSLVIGVRY